MKPAYPFGAEEPEKGHLQGRGRKVLHPGHPDVRSFLTAGCRYVGIRVLSVPIILSPPSSNHLRMFFPALFLPASQDLFKKHPASSWGFDPFKVGFLPCKKEGVTAQDYVSTPAGHVRRNRYSTQSSRLGDNICLHFMILGIEDPVLDPPGLQDPSQGLGTLYRSGPYQNGLSGLVGPFNIAATAENSPAAAEDPSGLSLVSSACGG